MSMERASCKRCSLLQMRCKLGPAAQEGSGCKACVVVGLGCEWPEAQVLKPESPLDTSYAEYLEARIRLVEHALKILSPGSHAMLDDHTLVSELVAGDQDASGSAHCSQSDPVIPTMQPISKFLNTPAISRLVQQVRLAKVGSEHVRANVDLASEDVVWDATLSTKSSEPRYHGQSSSEALSRDATLFRSWRILSTPPTSHRRSEFWTPTSAEMRQLQRLPPDIEAGLALELPPDDLMPMLLDAYFDNAFFPIVHRPLFEKQLREGLHFREISFLRVVLLICACGARWCDDPRVFDDRWPVSLSSGHRWFRQFSVWMKSATNPQISLWDAQTLALTPGYLCGTSASYGMWIMIGSGIRLMQDVGSHRKRSVVTLESEMHKRCFWTMMFLDRFQSINLGRHGAMQDLDSDLDDVLEVDDEYWSLEPNAPPPTQPAGVPSKLGMFNQLIGLTRIAGRCLQTVYALERTKGLVGLDGIEGAVWMYKDINAQLDQWVRNVPPHLRLPSDYNSSPLFSDSVTMWSTYYELVISANRPFIAKTSSPLASPCLKLCLGAARACTHMIDAYRRSPGSRILPGLLGPAFSSSMILVIDLITRGKIREPSTEPGQLYGRVYTMEQKAEDVRRCMHVLEWSEKRFQIAGRLRDMVREFEKSWRSQLSSSSGQSDPPDCVSQPQHNIEAEVTFDISGPPETIFAAGSTTLLGMPFESTTNYPPFASQPSSLHSNSPQAGHDRRPFTFPEIYHGHREDQPYSGSDKSAEYSNYPYTPEYGCYDLGNLSSHVYGYVAPGNPQTYAQQHPPDLGSADVYSDDVNGCQSGSSDTPPIPLIAQWNTTMQNTIYLSQKH